MWAYLPEDYRDLPEVLGQCIVEIVHFIQHVARLPLGLCTPRLRPCLWARVVTLLDQVFCLGV